MRVPKFRITRKQKMKGLEGLGPADIQYWRTFLKRSMIHKENIAIYIDPAVVKSFRKAVSDHFQMVLDGWNQTVTRGLSVKNGEIFGGSGMRGKMFFPIGGWRNDLYLLSLDRLGVFSVQITRQGGRTKVWITQAGASGADQQGWWGSELGAFHSFIQNCDDDDLLQLWLEFQTSQDIRRELVRRAHDFQPTHPPKLSYKKLLRISNIEYRRALVQFCEINWPEPFMTDKEGELIEFNEWINILRVTCPSTGRMYHLGVPVSCETPTQARFWTLGFDTEVDSFQPNIIAEA